jgi:hypothetical protein
MNDFFDEWDKEPEKSDAEREAEAKAEAKAKAEKLAADHAEAKRLKKASMKQVKENANPEWSALMLELTRQSLMDFPQMTTDEPIFRYEAIEDPNKPVTHEKRAMGPVMNKAARLGYCRRTDRVTPSRRPKLHHSPICIWESLIYDKG